MLKSSCLSQYKLYSTPISPPFFFIHNKRLYCISNNIFIQTFILILLFHLLIHICHYFLQNYLHYTLRQHNNRHKTKYVVNNSALPLNYQKPQYKWTNLMCGNTRPKLLEVSYWKASQHNKGLFTTSSPHFTEYFTNLKHARHGGFQTLDIEHRIDSRRPLNKHLTLRQRQTKTEVDEDRDRRRQRQTKTEIDEDWQERSS